MQQSSSKFVIVVLFVLMVLIGLSMVLSNDYSTKELLNDVLAGFIVFGFFVLILAIIKKSTQAISPYNPKSGDIQ